MRFGIRIAAFLLAFWVSMPLQAQQGQYYVLDGFGGVHAGGGAAAIAPATPYFGFDIAKGIAFVPLGNSSGHGNGVLVLDGFGGVHAGGALASAAPSPTPPYFGFDVARAITYRNVPPRGVGSFTDTGLTVSSSSFVVLTSTTIHAPDDGYLLVTGTSELHCGGSTGGAQAEFSVGLNGTTPPSGLDLLQQIPSCAVADSRIYAITHMYSVPAGFHTVNLLGRMVSATPSVVFTDRSLTVIFIDQNGVGSS